MSYGDPPGSYPLPPDYSAQSLAGVVVVHPEIEDAIASDKSAARAARNKRHYRNRRLGIHCRLVLVTDGELDRLVEKGYLTTRGDAKVEGEAIAAALSDFLAGT